MAETETKFGINQLDRPSPLWYRRFSNAMIIFIIPALVVLVDGLHLKHALTDTIKEIIIFIPSLIKGIGTMMGNGQYYTPSNSTIDNLNNKN